MTWTAFAGWIIVSTHVLAGAAWFGAMFYSLVVLHPRARQFFRSDAEFEEFIATLANGARWKMLSGFATIGVSGLVLIPFVRPHSWTRTWIALIAAKSALLLLAVGIFCYVSWWLWPSRIFATPDEIPAIQRKFRRIAIALITIAALPTILGLLARYS